MSRHGHHSEAIVPKGTDFFVTKLRNVVLQSAELEEVRGICCYNSRSPIHKGRTLQRVPMFKRYGYLLGLSMLGYNAPLVFQNEFDNALVLWAHKRIDF